MSTLRRFILYLLVVSAVFVTLSLGLMDLLLQPAATALSQKTPGPMAPRIAAFYERKREAAEYARRAAERDRAEAERLSPLPKPRVAHQPPKRQVQVSAAKRNERAPPNAGLGHALGYAPRPQPFFTPNDRHGN